MTGKLDAEAKRLRKLTDGALADEVGGLEARIAALKSEAIRRNREGPTFATNCARSRRPKAL